MPGWLSPASESVVSPVESPADEAATAAFDEWIADRDAAAAGEPTATFWSRFAESVGSGPGLRRVALAHLDQLQTALIREYAEWNDLPIDVRGHVESLRHIVQTWTP